MTISPKSHSNESSFVCLSGCMCTTLNSWSTKYINFTLSHAAVAVAVLSFILGPVPDCAAWSSLFEDVQSCGQVRWHWKGEIFLSHSKTRSYKQACASSLISYSEQYLEYDAFLTTPEPSNPWISDDASLWDLESRYNQSRKDCISKIVFLVKYRLVFINLLIKLCFGLVIYLFKWRGRLTQA